MARSALIVLALLGALAYAEQISVRDEPETHSGPTSNPHNASREAFITMFRKLITAHAVMATVAFGWFFPVGSIMIRLCSFPGLWWIHGLWQTFAFVLYTAAFGIGLFMSTRFHAFHEPHVVIGIILWCLLAFEPILGLLHHYGFVKSGRRMGSSYAHIWIGRIVITVAIINGGLGLQLAQRYPIAPPGTGRIVGYSIAAGFMWLCYVLAAIIGERRRAQKLARSDNEMSSEPKITEDTSSGMDSNV